jgi:hypothetical protein
MAAWSFQRRQLAHNALAGKFAGAGEMVLISRLYAGIVDKPASLPAAY